MRALASASPDSAIDSLRKILFAAATLLAGATLLAPAAGAADGPSPPRAPRLVHAQLEQKGRELVFSVRTSAPVALSKLDARPDTRRAGARYLCLALGAPGGGERRLCLGGRRKVKRRAGLVVAGADGRPIERRSVPATVKRPAPRKLVLALVPGDAGLAPRRYGWRAVLSGGCEVRRRCARQLPPEAAPARRFRLRPVRAVGCTGGGAGLLSAGPRDRPLVALTFDDGPSEYTGRFLDVLRDKGVPATFFEVGQAMPGRGAVMRRILAEGHEIGDHTMSHVELPGAEQIAGAAELIRRYTHFRPCLFRPPGGALSDGVVQTAGALGMRTITWDVDPRDWAQPGSGAIYANVVANARNGSIVVMHDGGGPRAQTLAALPRVIDALRARGLGFATVSELLGNELIYRPYG